MSRAWKGPSIAATLRVTDETKNVPSSLNRGVQTDRDVFNLVGTIDSALQCCGECLHNIKPGLFHYHHLCRSNKISIKHVLEVRTNRAISWRHFVGSLLYRGLIRRWFQWRRKQIAVGIATIDACFIMRIFIFYHFCNSWFQPMVVIIIVVIAIVNNCFEFSSIFPSRPLRDCSTEAWHWFFQIYNRKSPERCLKLIVVKTSKWKAFVREINEDVDYYYTTTGWYGPGMGETRPKYYLARLTSPIKDQEQSSLQWGITSCVYGRSW